MSAPLTIDSPLTIYTTTWCGPCRRLKSQLIEAGIAFDEINIETDDLAAGWVTTVNAGNQTVPTVRFADESTMTNPSLIEITAKLAELDAPLGAPAH
jgi:mycoredoxin